MLCGVLTAVPIQGQLPVTGPGAASDTTVLTLDEARRLALGENPAFRATSQRQDQALGDLVSARTYSLNPELQLEAPGGLSGAPPSRYELRLSQEIEWAGQRGLRVDAAQSASDATFAAVRDAARQLLRDVEVAFHELIAARNRRSVASQITTSNERLLRAVRVQLDEGEVSLLQANLVEIEAGRARARVLVEDGAVRKVELTLGRLLGLSPIGRLDPLTPEEPRSLPSATELSEVDLIEEALERRPDLAASRARVEQFRSLDRLATREALPNLRLHGIAEREGPDAATRWGVGLSLALPLFDRNQGIRFRRDAEVREASLRHDASQLQVRTEVANALQAYRAAAEELEVFEASVLGPAAQNQALLDTSYAEGKLDLETLLLIRNQLLDAELGYWEAWARQREAWAFLRSATGSVLEDATAINDEGLR
jgi:cobalt-zinc-cadmium efflux system outer membrane protein